MLTIGSPEKSSDLKKDAITLDKDGMRSIQSKSL